MLEYMVYDDNDDNDFQGEPANNSTLLVNFLSVNACRLLRIPTQLAPSKLLVLAAVLRGRPSKLGSRTLSPTEPVTKPIIKPYQLPKVS